MQLRYLFHPVTCHLTFYNHTPDSYLFLISLQQSMTAVYVVTYIWGYGVWKFTVFSFSSGELFEIIMYGKLFLMDSF